MNEFIKNWYMDEYDDYDGGSDINENIKFSDLLGKMLKSETIGDNLYEYIGDIDSIVRERIFERLSELLGVKYDDIYTNRLGF